MTAPGTSTGFDEYAAEYEACCARGLALAGESKEYFARGRVAWLVDWLAERGAGEPRCVADFGCGVGDVTALLAESFPAAEVVGVDVSEGCLARARSEYGGSRVRFEAVDAAPQAQADLVHCNGVMHHVPPAERSAVIGRMAAMLRPGGHLCIFENNPWNPGTHWVMRRIPFDRDARMLRPARMRSLVRRGDVSVLDTAFLFFFPRMLRVLRAVEPRLRHVPFGAQYAVIGQMREA